MQVPTRQPVPIGKKTRAPRILFIAMATSIHTARWIGQLYDKGYDIHLFPSTGGVALHPDLHGKVTFHPILPSNESGPRYSGVSVKLPVIANAVKMLTDRIAPDYEVERLSRLLERLKPDVVHCLELQAAGYIALTARDRLESQFPFWMVSNWGSDIYLFGRLPQHQRRLRRLLEGCDFYLSECHRDVKLARELGLPPGTPTAVIPAAGGLPLDTLSPWRATPPSQRKRLMVKGYQNFAGRALFALRAIELVADLLADYQVIIYSADGDVELAAQLLGQRTGLNVKLAVPTSHETMLRLHGQARISLGISISDGLATSFLEAMTMGSFPIQSNTACASEWVEDGYNALLVEPEDPEKIAEALRRALDDDDLVDQAARANFEIARERLCAETLRDRTVAIYAQVFGEKLQR